MVLTTEPLKTSICPSMGRKVDVALMVRLIMSFNDFVKDLMHFHHLMDSAIDFCNLMDSGINFCGLMVNTVFGGLISSVICFCGFMDHILGIVWFGGQCYTFIIISPTYKVCRGYIGFSSPELKAHR